jgi:phospholipid/cholesterol/gamma-HCH transport system substrate-binding protein
VKDNFFGALWRLTVFVTVCLLTLFALYAVFGQLRFQEEKSYNAEFTNVAGLQAGDFVRIGGVEVGKVKKVAVKQNAYAVVEFTADDTVVLTRGTRAVIRYDNLIGGRFLALEEGTGSVDRLRPGQTIPLNRTAPALDLDALIGGFRPLFRALDPRQTNALTGQLISAFEGQGVTVASFLAQTSALTNTLADRDDLIGQVIVKLNNVLGSLGDQSDQFATAVDSLSQLVKGLADRRTDVTRGLANLDTGAASVAGLLSQARPPLRRTVAESDRATSIVVADHAYFDDLLNTLPDAYQQLGRQGLYGDYFSFYLCDLVLKVNGKGGQPVFVKLAGQATGRCAPQ